jgi:hypothetical protein
MATFTKNVPITQPAPTITVDVTATAPLPLGVNRFQLVVIDNAGNESAPVTIDIVVRDTGRPTAVLDLVNAAGAIVTPPNVAFGQSFTLSGRRSTDTGGGTVAQYRFTLIDAPA